MVWSGWLLGDPADWDHMAWADGRWNMERVLSTSWRPYEYTWWPVTETAIEMGQEKSPKGPVKPGFSVFLRRYVLGVCHFSPPPERDRTSPVELHRLRWIQDTLKIIKRWGCQWCDSDYFVYSWLFFVFANTKMTSSIKHCGKRLISHRKTIMSWFIRVKVAVLFSFSFISLGLLFLQRS